MALVQAGDVQLEYLDEGSGDNVAVLIHGAGLSARIWHTVQKELAEGGIRSLAIGTRGAGGSDHTENDEDYHPANYSRDLATAVTELGLRGDIEDMLDVFASATGEPWVREPVESTGPARSAR